MTTNRLPYTLGVLIILVATLLMWRPMEEETATVDETTFIGGGYGYFQTGSCKMAEENPILSLMILGAPLLAFDVQMSDTARAIMEQKLFTPTTSRWGGGGPAVPFRQLFPNGPNWYHFGLPEAQYFGQILVYDPRNNAEKLMFWSRFTQLLLTLATGIFVFFWAAQLSRSSWAGVLAMALWLLNPITLAYGNLAITDPSIVLMTSVAIWWFCKTLQSGTSRNAFVLGVITSVAIMMKFMGLLLPPIFVGMLIVAWLRPKTRSEYRVFSLSAKRLLWLIVLAMIGGWVALLVVYFPHWNAPPPIDPQQAADLRIPGWFLTFQPLLIPADFFKAVAVKILHNQVGHEGYLFGQWSKEGWWYYYFVAMALKTPLPILLLIVVGIGLVVLRRRDASFVSLAPWLATAFYMALSVISKVDVGVRHVMPVYPLLAVGAADQISRAGRRWQNAAIVLSLWVAAVAFLSYPFYIPYFNELAGGTANGYKALVDSNYDWGQDGNRLKTWMEQNGIKNIYLDYFGTQASIEYLKIPNTRVSADQARQIKDGWLVVSVSELMRPEWAWLRESREPTARVADTLFVYQFGHNE